MSLWLRIVVQGCFFFLIVCCCYFSTAVVTCALTPHSPTSHLMMTTIENLSSAVAVLGLWLWFRVFGVLR